ncbi:DGQHR domain-containing protein [Nocardia kruczakiae]|uniref:DGQHR domain-containing protein n=1 Tax=Nocardia kruczakiae TaxID=261477 RepID=UPI0014289E36|nr:DGQHR domain-containing protein [Nocardia kruczakiae]
MATTVSTAAVAEYEQNGWMLERTSRRGSRMKREKDVNEIFSDQVWITFAKLGFEHLSTEGQATTWLSHSVGASTEISVFAADAETAIVVLCKSFEKPTSYSFRSETQFIREYHMRIRGQIRERFPDRKVRFVVAANNCVASVQVRQSLVEANISFLDVRAVNYYSELSKHLGSAAKYQLLGHLFAGQKIQGLDSRVVAVEARMGGRVYYSFTIEPERLLKIAFVLHQNPAVDDLLPTYQRLIRRKRLNDISKFVENGGFFPNSIVLNVDSGRRGPHFELLGGQPRGSNSRVGVLHLPQHYRAAYVIDGQHRLYGYANSARSATDLIPVVAFMDLDRSAQVKLFMEINERQQAVPKSLRLTLEGDLLSDSDDLRQRARSVVLHVAHRLGESETSPLYGRILIGEVPKTSIRCISMDAVRRGVASSNFIGTFNKSSVRQPGTFFRGWDDLTSGPLEEFLEIGLSYFKDGLVRQWELGSSDGGFVFINNGVEAMIRLLSDIVDIVTSNAEVAPLNASPSAVFEKCKPYADAAIRHLRELSAAEGLEYRKQYGSGGAVWYWRRLQQAVRAEHAGFDPSGLDDFIEKESKRYNKASTEIVQELETFLKTDIRSRLEQALGDRWYKQGVPKAVQKQAGLRCAEKNVDLDIGEEIQEWDCLYLVNYREILCYKHDQWKALFEDQYTRPRDVGASGSWKDKTSWITKLNEIRNDTHHGRSVKEEDYAFLLDLKTWLLVD